MNIGQEDARKLKKVLKKISTEIKTLYDQTSGDRRVQILNERLVKEINEEAKLESELLISRLQYETSMHELNKFKQDCAHEKSQKQKLESYCNELQNKHKQIVDDANKSSEEERVRRSKLSEDFNNDLQTSQKKLEEVAYQRAEYMKYNEMLKEKMKELLGYVEERDKTYSQMLEEKTNELEEYKAKIEEKPKDEEIKLRAELDEYKKKFEDFQTSLTQSNQHFSNFKKEMDAKTKLFKQLQKENNDIKKREQESESTLKTLKEEVDNLTKVVQKFETDIGKLNELKSKLTSS
ncbi:hypothetical protein SteCoe_4470 [Stentor coeruleus]|uniref:Uncharacterized protein n=1 Tax=Stentor coeruleus TaxID=5963 RepID=A0A1R2CUR3_9CILI|nr:hypothetical protein SteCoe_4470 [Stentor coeruleus]